MLPYFVLDNHIIMLFPGDLILGLLVIRIFGFPFLPYGKKCINQQHNRLLLERLQGICSSWIVSTDTVAVDRVPQLTA